MHFKEVQKRNLKKKFLFTWSIELHTMTDVLSTRELK